MYAISCLPDILTSTNFFITLNMFFEAPHGQVKEIIKFFSLFNIY